MSNSTETPAANTNVAPLKIHGPIRPAEADTFAKLLAHNARKRGARPANREKKYGIWQSWAWDEVEAEIQALSAGLKALGLEHGDKVSIVGDNRPRLYWTFIAVQAAGGVPVPMYQDSVAEEMQYVLEHASVRFAVVEDQEQVDKLLEVKSQCPLLEAIVYEDDRGMRKYRRTDLHHYKAVQELGRSHLEDNPNWYEDSIAKGNASDVALIAYTSGTTGRSKGVILTQSNVLSMAEMAAKFDGLQEDEETLAYLPPAWIGDFCFSMAQAYVCGFCVSCPEDASTVMHDLRELGPTYFFAPPRIFENVLTTVMIRMEDASAIKRAMFKYFLEVAKDIGLRLIDGKKVSVLERLKYGIGELLVYGPLKNTLGLSRVRVGYTAGEAIGPDIFDFYRSIGINLKQLFGQTEASVFIAMQPDGEIKPDTCGVPIPNVEIRIDDQTGEVLYRSPGVFQEYYKNAEATAATKTADGWVHTGDAGVIDPDGHLKIIDRAKDVGKLNNGAMFAPKFIENKLKFFPNIREVVAFGDGRDQACCFINIDLEAVGNWAERNNVSYASYQELASHPQVYEAIKGHVEQVNRDLASDAHLAGAQIHRFLILHKELDADDGELTRTRKVRRSPIAEKYGTLIDALYAGKQSQYIETQVTFEDGRTGKISAEVKIAEAETYTPMQAAS